MREQLWVQFAWEVENIRKDVEPFLAMSRDEQLNVVDVFICRLEVARARLNLLRQTLDSERTIFPNSDLA